MSCNSTWLEKEPREPCLAWRGARGAAGSCCILLLAVTEGGSRSSLFMRLLKNMTATQPESWYSVILIR